MKETYFIAQLYDEINDDWYLLGDYSNRYDTSEEAQAFIDKLRNAGWGLDILTRVAKVTVEP